MRGRREPLPRVLLQEVKARYFNFIKHDFFSKTQAVLVQSWRRRRTGCSSRHSGVLCIGNDSRIQKSDVSHMYTAN